MFGMYSPLQAGSRVERLRAARRKGEAKQREADEDAPTAPVGETTVHGSGGSGKVSVSVERGTDAGSDSADAAAAGELIMNIELEDLEATTGGELLQAAPAPRSRDESPAKP
jgi:hypothetical protein